MAELLRGLLWVAAAAAGYVIFTLTLVVLIVLAVVRAILGR